MKLIRLLLALVLVAGLLPMRGEASAAANHHCITTSVAHHTGDDTSCPSPADNRLQSSGTCCAVPLPTGAVVTIAPPRVVTAWGLPIEPVLTGRLQRPATPPPRI